MVPRSGIRRAADQAFRAELNTWSPDLGVAMPARGEVIRQADEMRDPRGWGVQVSASHGTAVSPNPSTASSTADGSTSIRVGRTPSPPRSGASRVPPDVLADQMPRGRVGEQQGAAETGWPAATVPGCLAGSRPPGGPRARCTDSPSSSGSALIRLRRTCITPDPSAALGDFGSVPGCLRRRHQQVHFSTLPRGRGRVKLPDRAGRNPAAHRVAGFLATPRTTVTAGSCVAGKVSSGHTGFRIMLVAGARSPPFASCSRCCTAASLSVMVGASQDLVRAIAASLAPASRIAR
jgi:hypothetical protein